MKFRRRRVFILRRQRVKTELCLRVEEMDLILKNYEEGQYNQCLKQLDNFTAHTLIEDFIVQNNVLASKFQNSYVQENELIRKTISEDFLKLWSKVLTLPYEKEFNLLTLSCACNAIYSLLNCKLANEDIGMEVTKIGYEALEQITCNHKVFIYQENNSHTDKFVSLVGQLLQCKKVQPDELSLVLYSCVLVCLVKVDQQYVQLIMNILENVESSRMIEKTTTFNYVFLLSPFQMSGGVINCCSNICDFARIFLSLNNCINSSWSEALALRPTKKSQLFDIWEVLSMYADFYSSNHKFCPSINVESLFTEGQMSFASFAVCIISAAKFSSENKPFVALKYLKYCYYIIVTFLNGYSMKLIFVLQFCWSRRNFKNASLLYRDGLCGDTV